VSVVEREVTRMDVALRLRQTRLEEMVVTATGERRRLELGNDVAVIDVPAVLEERPVTSIADLLEGRVPGLTVQRSSGAPGDPSRIRIRGQGSVNRGNDPIVIIDGIRIYAEQSAERSANLANGTRRSGPGTGYAAPSPLDNIDLSAVEKIEVLKGPSAATLYGADAANGVIVITSKRGRSGPPSWNVSVERGTSTMPGRYPVGMVHWGHDPLSPDSRLICGPLVPGCVSDSLVTFQTLNDPELTFLDRGERSAVQLGVSGGAQRFSYSLTGNYSDEVGMVRLPELEVARFEQRTGQAPPEWMQRPQGMKQWGLSSRVTTDVGSRGSVALSTALSHGQQRRSSLESQLTSLMTTYVDRASGTYYPAQPSHVSTLHADDRLIDRFMERATAGNTSFMTGLNVTWRARDWLTTTMDAGVDLKDREDHVYLMRGMANSRDNVDTLGRANLGRGRSLVSTLNGRATIYRGLPLDWRMDASVGANYMKRSVADVSMRGADLPAGTSSITQAAEILGVREYAEDATSFGVYVEPTFSHRQRLWVSTGIRMDGGSTYGSNVSMPIFPKVSASYLISEERFFPFRDRIGTLRLRAAYGHAGVQPGPADRLRLYSRARTWENGGFMPGAAIETLGNTELRPERSEEMEGGFDADLLGDRLTISATAYRKTTVDALMQMPVAPSVYGHDVSILRNVGVIRNTGREVQLRADLLRHDALSWNMTATVMQNRNLVVELGPGVEPFNTSQNERVVAGYPLGGRWVTPILGYSDRDGDGAIGPHELLLGDTLVYMGASQPNYNAGLQSTFSFFRRALTVTAAVDYADDLTQEGTWRQFGLFAPGYADPNAPLDAQAAIVGGSYNRTHYWDYQTVSTLRLSSVSVTWAVPRTLAERARARALSVSLQGSNLGLRTDYRGLDPHVNGHSTGNGVQDTGVIPQPRRWQLRVSAQY
jgi:TonB-linked SusC/RagA family outer membrane protein